MQTSVDVAPFAYVTSLFNENFVNVVDTANKTLVTRIPMKAMPSGLAVSPDATLVYVGL
jgi:YVTN family beta-propeller protein